MKNRKSQNSPHDSLNKAERSAAQTHVRAEPIAQYEQSKLEPGLYITATPIGNLRDITLRALDALMACDSIICEDTRVTRKLLTAFGIVKPLKTYHDHNAAKMRPRILQSLSRGASICLVSDAGMPLISDPGYQLVRAAVGEGLKVTVLPGASASLAALALSGLPSDKFLFAGFLPAKAGPRRRQLQALRAVPGSLVFFEAASRLGSTLNEMHQVLGPRGAALAREITKKFEDVRRGSLQELAAYYAAHPPPKGEMVIVIGPPSKENDRALDPQAELRRALHYSSTKAAVAEVAALTGLPRKKIYDLALSLQAAGDESA